MEENYKSNLLSPEAEATTQEYQNNKCVETSDESGKFVEEVSSQEVFELFRTPAKFQPRQQRKKTPKRKFDNFNSYSDSECEPRLRTPSGQPLSNSVGNLKSLLESKGCGVSNKFENSQRSKSVGHDEESVNADKSEASSEIDAWRGTSQPELEKQTVLNSNYHDESVGATVKRIRIDQSKLSLIPEGSQDQEFSKQTNMKEVLNAIEKMGEKMKQAVADNTGVEAIKAKSNSTDSPQADGDSNPEVMDVRIVISMLADLKVQIEEGMRAKTADDVSSAGADTEYRAKLQQISSQLTICEAKQKHMIDTMARMSDLIEELQIKNEVYENSNAKRMLILSGLETDTKKYVAKRQIIEFIHDEVGINTRLDDFYFIGNSSPREIVLIFPSISDQCEVYSNRFNLKDIVNKDGKKFYLREFKRSKHVELAKKGAAIEALTADEGGVNQQVVKTVRDDIYVGDDKYTPQVVPPDPTKVLQYSLPELNRIMSIPLHKGKKLECNGNFFTPYTVCVSTYKEIQDAYMKIRLNHADARHIVCAWSIPGSKVYEATDCCDDEDHGSALPILNLFKSSEITFRAVYVVRKCGKKLNEQRIPMYLQAAREVIQKYPENLITKKIDTIKTADGGEADSGAKKTYAKVAASPPSYRGRGGQRGRGRRAGGRQRGGRGGRPKRIEDNTPKRTYSYGSNTEPTPRGTPSPGPL